jgi:two-component system response regulator RegX3
MRPGTRILLVEDDRSIASFVEPELEHIGYQVRCAYDGPSGLEEAKRFRPELIILDIMLPSLDGFAVCDAIRQHSREQPLVILTAKTTDEDIITGLTLGADDYVAKPFSVRELVLRAEAVLRRSARRRYEEAQLCIGAHLQIDTRNLVGTQQGNAEPILFTRREVEILQYLKQHHDRPVSREELLVEVWGYARASRFETRTVDIHMAKLRRKIEPNPKIPTVLITVRGEGYRLLAGA